MASQEFVAIMEQLDVPAMRRAWPDLFAHMPAPKDDEAALVTLHMSRTQSSSLRRSLRFYSHRWLTERGLPSQLPDYLRPAAERMYPRPGYGVGLIVWGTRSKNKGRREGALYIRGQMENAVLDIDADGKLLDNALVTRRLDEIRKKSIDYVYK